MTAATATTEGLVLPAEMESAAVVPTPLAIFGLIFLTLAPFAWLTNNVRMVLSGIGVFLYVVARPKILSAHNFIPSWPTDKSRLREIYMWLTLLFFHAIFCSIISAAILLPSGEVTPFDFLDRNGTQLISLLLAFLQVTSGFHVAKYVKLSTIRTAIYVGFWTSIATSIYQSFSNDYGLPYLGREVFDPRVGLRPCGLAGEPKTLAVHLVVMVLFLLLDKPPRQIRKLFGSFMRIAGIVLAAHFFVAASSGNGWISATILVVLYFFFLSNMRTSFMGIALGLLAFIAVVSFGQISLSEVQLRDNHKAIFDNLSNLDLGLFDDLVALPMMAWLDNPLSVLVGFGPGVLHFFANRHLDQAGWLTGTTYIDGNVSSIAFISNFGLLVAGYIFVDIFRKGRRAVECSKDSAERRIRIFFFASFVVGATVGGNVGCPFYVSVGCILAMAGLRAGTSPVGNSAFRGRPDGTTPEA